MTARAKDSSGPSKELWFAIRLCVVILYGNMRCAAAEGAAEKGRIVKPRAMNRLEDEKELHPLQHAHNPGRPGPAACRLVKPGKC